MCVWLSVRPSVCSSVCLSVIISLYGCGYFVYVDTVNGSYGHSLLCFVGCFSMIIWKPTVLSVISACALCFCIFTWSA